MEEYLVNGCTLICGGAAHHHYHIMYMMYRLPTVGVTLSLYLVFPEGKVCWCELVRGCVIVPLLVISA